MAKAYLAKSSPVVPKVGSTAPLGAVKRKWAIGGGEVEMGGWGAIEAPVNKYISVVWLTVSDQMS